MPTRNYAPTRSARFARALTFSTLAVVIVACGGGGGAAPTSPGNTNTSGSQTIANVSISGNTTSVAVGATVPLSATARNATGAAVGATFAWSSNNSAVATVGAATGVVTGVAVGNATITASAGGFTGTRVITVTSGGSSGPPPLSAQIDMPGTAFEPNAVTIGVGGTITWIFTSIAHDVLFGTGAGVQDMPLTTNATLSRTFNTKGTFSMTCTAHAGMTGSITVQ